MLLIINLMGVAFACYVLDRFFYEISYHRAYLATSPRPEIIAFFLLSHIFLWTVAWRFGKVQLNEISRATWPLSMLCLYGLVIKLESSQIIWLMYLALALIGFCIYRVLLKWRTPIQMSWRTAWIVAILMTLLFFAWTLMFQHAMYTRFLLGFKDVGIYYKRIWNTIAFGAFHQVDSDTVRFQYHFGPGLILLVPFLAFNQTVTFLSTVQSLFICGTAILLFWMVKRRNGSACGALAICLAYLFYPAVTQQTYCYSYGFHPPTLALPLTILSFYFIEDGKYRAAILPTILSWSMQEHICIYYFGMGTAWFLSKRYRVGLVCIALSLGYFLLVTKCLMPKAPEKDTIVAVNFWSTLGGSMSEIMFSPFNKPGTFFRLFTNHHNFHLLIQLLLPLGFFCFISPRFVLGLWPIFLFNFLRIGLVSTCIAFQYQTLTIGILFLASVIGITDTLGKGKSMFTLRILNIRSALKINVVAWLGAAVGTSILASIFLGLVPWARQNNGVVVSTQKQLENLAAFRDIRRLIPLEASVTSDHRSRILFVNHRLSIDYQSKRDLETEYHVYQERYFNTPPEEITNQVEKILATTNYRLIYRKHGFYVLQRTTPMPPLPSHVF